MAASNEVFGKRKCVTYGVEEGVYSVVHLWTREKASVLISLRASEKEMGGTEHAHVDEMLANNGDGSRDLC